MSIFEALILGLVQGLTEFIPVSSSGHLLLMHELFGTNESSLAFDVALHVGTLMALLVYFRQDVLVLIKNFTKSNKNGRLARVLLISAIPAVIAGLLFSGFIDERLRSPLVVSITLAIVGILMLIVDRKINEHEHGLEVSKNQGLLIGLAQATALIPGVSRSGATITAGIFLGLNRQQAARFSFLMAIPIIAGSALGVLLKDGDSLQISTELWVAMIVAFLSGMAAIKILLNIIAKVGLKPFAYYRIALAIIVLIVLV